MAAVMVAWQPRGPVHSLFSPNKLKGKGEGRAS